MLHERGFFLMATSSEKLSPSSSPIVGIFDSGLGGLTVTREIIQQTPSLPIIYFGDTARFPYGSKSPETISRYAIENTIFLMEKGATCIVVACNTATSIALPLLKRTFSVPIFGVIDPAAQDAAKATKTKKIAVIGTTGTIKTKSYERAIQSCDPTITVFSQACPLLVTLIEEGSPCFKITNLIIQAYLEPLLNAGVDTLLLGCTHYPLIKETIADYCQGKVVLIDPAESASHALSQTLGISSHKLEHQKIDLECYSSDDVGRFREAGERFLGFPLTRVSQVRL